MLSPETPYPLHGGGALRTASLLNYLAQHHDVDLIVFRHRPNQDPARALPPGLVRSVQVIDLPQNGTNPIARIVRNVHRLARGVPPLVDRFRGFSRFINQDAQYEIAVIEHFWCAEYYDVLSAISKRIVLNLHNIESVWHDTCAAVEPFPRSIVHRQFAAQSRELEKNWLHRFDTILIPSHNDAQRLRARYPDLNLVVYPNAVPLVPVPDRKQEDVIAFSGNLEYQPNRTAVQFFARKVWPELSRRFPQLRWRLIGMNPQFIQGDIENLPRVEVTGSVADSVRELAAAKVVVAPVLSGSGTRLKIIEAWAAARPVVSTALGAEGISCRNKHNILLAESPEEFINSIDRLLNSEELRREVGDAGRYLYEQEFSWDAVWRRLDCSRFLRGD